MSVDKKAQASKSRSQDEGSAKIASAEDQLKIIQTVLEDAKALDVVVVDLAGKTSIADYMVVASGRSQRHVGAVAGQISRTLREQGYGRPRVEGLPHCDWVLIDGADIIVHIFRPEVREFYNLEKLWSEHVLDEKMAV
jgi:ribosome-associated protein